MNLKTAQVFIRDAVDWEQRIIIQRLSDEDLAGSSGDFLMRWIAVKLRPIPSTT